MFPQVPYAVRIGEAIMTYLQHGPIHRCRLSCVGSLFGVAHHQSPNPTKSPIVVDPNDVIFIKGQALFIKETRPPIKELRDVRLNVGIKEGTMFGVPYPVSQRLNQRNLCLIHRLSTMIRPPAFVGRAGEYG